MWKSNSCLHLSSIKHFTSVPPQTLMSIEFFADISKRQGFQKKKKVRQILKIIISYYLETNKLIFLPNSTSLELYKSLEEGQGELGLRW